MKKVKSAVLTLVLLLSLCVPALEAGAEDVVVFTDPVLEAMVREQMGKPEGDITAADAANVRDLYLEMNQEDWSIPRISNLDGMQYFVNLVTLDLGWALAAENMQVDLAPLSGLTKLERLTLQCDGIRDISALSGLVNMRELWIWGNGEISDISALAGMTQMESIWIFGDQISDISVLANMPNLYRVLMADNRVTDLYPLAGLNNLTTLELRNSPIWDYTEIASIYPQLTEKDFDINDVPAYNRPENPDEVVAFHDVMLENKIREALGKPEGDITAGDAAMLKWLNADADSNAPDSERIRDISALRYFVNLTGLTLNGNAIQDISALQGLTKLQNLWLGGNPINDPELLSGLTKMVRLGFDGGFREITFLSNMPDLEELRIDALGELPADLPRLKKLNIFCSLGGELTDISLLAQVPSLTVIDLSWNMVSDIAPLASLPLTELYLAGNPIEDYSPVKDLIPQLLGRDFDYFEITPAENPDEVITFPDPVLERKIRAAISKPEGDITAGDAAKITNLNISNEWQPEIPKEIQVTNLQGIESFINLRKLDISFSAISDIRALSTLTELRDLNLGGNAVTDLTPLTGFVNLEGLTLFGSRIHNLDPLAGLQQMRNLHLGSNPANDLSPLAGLTRLECLYMGGCGIEDIGPLAGMTNMFSLELTDNYITDLTPLAGMRNLHILKLNNNPIQDYAPITDIYPQLEEKDFELGQVFDVDVPLKPENPDAEVPIGDAALEAILREATGVYDRPLTQEDLCSVGKFSMNADTPEKLIYDISALRYCLNLAGIELYGAAISDLSPLSGLTKLRVLVIDNAMVSDVAPLAGKTTLQYLELANNHLTDISALATLTQLQGLDVSGNQITDFSPLYGLENLDKLKINFNASKDVSGLKEIVGRLKEWDFDPNQPLEQNQGNGGNNEGGNSGMLQPENPDAVIAFADPMMEQFVRKALNKPEGELTAGDAAVVEWLPLGTEGGDGAAEGMRITDLAGLEAFINLIGLELQNQNVRDLKPVTILKKLEVLNLLNNGIADISLLADMQSLRWIELRYNAIEDFSPLGGLTNLTGLLLQENPCKDFKPLKTIYPNLTDKDF